MKTNLVICLASVLCLGATAAEAKSFDYYMAHDAQRTIRLKECRDYMDRHVHGPDDLRAFFKTARGVDCGNAQNAAQRKALTFKDPSKGRTYLSF